MKKVLAVAGLGLAALTVRRHLAVQIAVGGSSAGGGLAAAVAQRSLDEGIPLRAQALDYPMLDDRTVLRDDHGGRVALMWTPRSNRFAWTSYLGRAPEPSDAPEYAAPARRNDLTGLPPASIASAISICSTTRMSPTLRIYKHAGSRASLARCQGCITVRTGLRQKHRQC